MNQSTITIFMIDQHMHIPGGLSGHKTCPEDEEETWNYFTGTALACVCTFHICTRQYICIGVAYREQLHKCIP
jgi:hypothetical protein